MPLPRIKHLVETYLEGWTAWAPIQDLRRRLVEPAVMIAKLHRYNSWRQLIPYMPDRELHRHAGYAEALIHQAPGRQASPRDHRPPTPRLRPTRITIRCGRR